MNKLRKSFGSYIYASHISEPIGLLRILYRSLKFSVLLCCILFALPGALFIRLLSPFVLIRFYHLAANRLGHFAANTELYLCELEFGVNTPAQPFIDICSINQPCNKQLALMWKRVLIIWPYCIVRPLLLAVKLLPGGCQHVVETLQHDRDILNLYSSSNPHLSFSAEEEALGIARLEELGIPFGSSFVCLTVRDNAYLYKEFPSIDFSYHNYRDSDVQNYVLAAESLANLGCFVIRMGSVVNCKINSSHSKVIDYATNGLRSDFMDIYLGANCLFCITQGTGFDSVPMIFRKPIVQVNSAPLGYCYTFGRDPIVLCKKHFDTSTNKELSLSEIFTRGVGFCLNLLNFDDRNVVLIENSPEEILDAVMEMYSRLNGSWNASLEDDSLQKQFWDIFPSNALDAFQGKPLHGNIESRFSAKYLRANMNWLK